MNEINSTSSTTPASSESAPKISDAVNHAVSLCANEAVILTLREIINSASLTPADLYKHVVTDVKLQELKDLDPESRRSKLYQLVMKIVAKQLTQIPFIPKGRTQISLTPGIGQLRTSMVQQTGIPRAFDRFVGTLTLSHVKTLEEKLDEQYPGSVDALIAKDS